MTAYALYNEIDPFAAAWLEQLIARGHIAPGVVDRRSIEDISPDDLRGFRQVHFFAGIGVWSYALRRAGVPDDANVWTGSCPCQPFSAAGKGEGVDDERHLWPHFHHLIRECRPELVFGEQVASKDGLAWLDLVHADMEGSSYAFGAVDTCAAGFGAPHIRQRLYWFGERLGRFPDTDEIERGWRTDSERLQSDGTEIGRLEGNCIAEPDLPIERMANGELPGASRHGQYGWPVSPQGRLRDGLTDCVGIGGLANNNDDQQRQGRNTGGTASQGLRFELGGCCVGSGLADSSSARLEGCDARSVGRERAAFERNGCGKPTHQSAPGPTNSFWSDADWLFCRDAKWRPVEPGTFPLAHGAAARVGRLRGYGNAINAEQALGFLEAFFEAKAIDVAPIHETTRNLDARSLTAELLGDLL